MSFEALNRFMAQEVPSARIPGCDLLIYHHGKLVFRRQYGFCDYLNTEPAGTHSYYYLYSCTKILTCAGLMHLAEQGKISLDDPLEKYIPAFGQVRLTTGEKPKQPILLRHCFAMTSGMNYNLKTPAILEVLRKNPNGSALEVAGAIAQTPLGSEPGTRYCYSASHDVLAAVAEAVTGERFSEYIRKWAFEPLGLRHLFFHPTEETRRNMAAPYVLEKDILKPAAMDNSYILSPNYDSGGAGLIARAEDYAQFLAALSVGGKGLLRPETIELMKEGQQSAESLRDFQTSKRFAPYTYALGVRSLLYPERTCGRIPIGEFGWDGAAGSYALVDTTNELAIFYAQHVRGCGYAYDVLHPEIRDRVYEELGL